MTSTLEDLLKQASKATPAHRIEYRDAIAAYGPSSISSVAPWLGDSRLGAFAVRVIVSAGRAGHRSEAYAALSSAVNEAPNEALRRDIQTGMVEFAPVSRRRPVAGQSGFELLDDSTELRGRPAVHYRIETHEQRGHFNVPRSIMDQLGIVTDGMVDMDVRRSATGGLVYSGQIGLAFRDRGLSHSR